MVKKPADHKSEQRIREAQNQERRRTEETLRLTQFAIDHSSDAVFWMDSTARFVYVNEAACRALSYSREELLRMTVHDIDPVFTRDKWPGHWADLKRRRFFIVESQHRTKDGRIFPVEIAVNYVKFGEKEINCAFARDISDRKEAEIALRKSEEKYRELFEQGSDLLCVHDLEGNLIDTNLAFKKEYGWDEKELVNMNIRNLIPERYRHEFSDYLKRVIEKGKDEGLLRVITKDGRELVLEYKNSLIVGENGPIVIHGSARDITERLQNERALRESEERYRLLVEEINDVIFRTDQNGILTFVSPVVKSVAGYDPSELIGQNFTKIIYHEDIDLLTNRFKELLSGVVKPSEYRIVNKAGEPIWVRSSSNLIYDRKNIVGVRGVITNISEEKRFQAQLYHSKKMEAIGTLAGGIAHEFNNALTGVVGNMQLLEMALPDNEIVRKHCEAMKGPSHRMAKLTNHLLAYAEGGMYQPKTLSMSDFVKDALPITAADMDPAIHIETDLPRDISPVKADTTQMQMVLSAVLNNAVESIEGEGRIRIETRTLDLKKEVAEKHPGRVPGPYVCLSVADDGAGMDEKTRSRVFDPFFTTKFQGRGMGMAAAYGIVINHGGWISVDSESGNGTAVEIYLPSIEAEATEKKAKAPDVKIITGTGTILVIEDEEMVMDVLRALLERLGYRILAAKTGKGAIDIAKTFDGQIDLALLDIKLPDMSGDKVYPLIMKERPDLKVMVCSGYAIDGPARAILDAGAQEFIQKPFSLETLSKKLKNALEGS